MSCDRAFGCYFTAAQFTIGEAPAKMKVTLLVLDGRFAIVRLSSNAGLPWWAASSEGFLSFTRSADETSIVCEERLVPSETKAERGFRALRVAGTVPFSATGVLASIAVPLAESGVSIVAISTFDTDYILVRETTLSETLSALREAGHSLKE